MEPKFVGAQYITYDRCKKCKKNRFVPICMAETPNIYCSKCNPKFWMDQLNLQKVLSLKLKNQNAMSCEYQWSDGPCDDKAVRRCNWCGIKVCSACSIVCTPPCPYDGVGCDDCGSVGQVEFCGRCAQEDYKGQPPPLTKAK